MLYDKLFDIDYNKIAIQLLPTNRRTPIMIAFVKVLVYLFKKQLKALKEERANNIYLLSHSSAVGHVQKVLNDRFDKVQRRITLGAGNRISPLYLYTEAEAKQTYLPKFVYTQKEIKERNTDFEVLVPAAVGLTDADLLALKFLTKKYTQPYRNFKIQVI